MVHCGTEILQIGGPFAPGAFEPPFLSTGGAASPSRPLDTEKGSMDELVAAAGVLAMSVDDGGVDEGATQKQQLRPMPSHGLPHARERTARARVRAPSGGRSFPTIPPATPKRLCLDWLPPVGLNFRVGETAISPPPCAISPCGP